MNKQASCKERWYENKQGRMYDLRRLWKRECEGLDPDPDLGSLNEYGLSFDYVPAGTFTDQRRGYWRYQLSTGGPQDEFRFYADHPTAKPYRIEYAFLDWFDGYTRKLTGKDEELLASLWRDWADCELTHGVFERAMSDK